MLRSLFGVTLLLFPKRLEPFDPRHELIGIETSFEPLAEVQTDVGFSICRGPMGILNGLSSGGQMQIAELVTPGVCL